MAYRLNDKHKEKAPGSRKRGNRTIAKEILYESILKQIRIIRPNFNIGIMTGLGGNEEGRWNEAYLHWSFKPRSSEYQSHLTKRGSKK